MFIKLTASISKMSARVNELCDKLEDAGGSDGDCRIMSSSIGQNRNIYIQIRTFVGIRVKGFIVGTA